jgi:hypothetical protein
LAVSLVIRLCICRDCQRSSRKSKHWEVDDRFCLLVHSRICHDVGSVRKFCSFVIRLVSSVFMTSRGIWILIGETFPTRTRAKQGALATGEIFAQLPAFLCLIHSTSASNWLWNFLLAFFTPFIVKSIAFRYGFVFACKYLDSYLSCSDVNGLHCSVQFTVGRIFCLVKGLGLNPY